MAGWTYEQIAQAISDSYDTTPTEVEYLQVTRVTDDSYMVRIKQEDNADFESYYLTPEILP